MKKEIEKQEKISQTVTLNVFSFLLFYVEKFVLLVNIIC